MNEKTRAYFGNVSISEWERIMGVELVSEDKEWLKNHHSEKVKYTNEQFHIFILPSLQIHVGTTIVTELIARLSKYDYSHSSQQCAVVETESEQ